MDREQELERRIRVLEDMLEMERRRCVELAEEIGVLRRRVDNLYRKVRETGVVW